MPRLVLAVAIALGVGLPVQSVWSLSTSGAGHPPTTAAGSASHATASPTSTAKQGVTKRTTKKATAKPSAAKTKATSRPTASATTAPAKPTKPTLSKATTPRVPPSSATPATHAPAAPPPATAPVTTLPPVAARVADPIAPMAAAALAALQAASAGSAPYPGLRASLAAAVAGREWTATAAQLDQAWAKAPASRMVAVLTALAQLGAPYVFGQHGPDTFDCSGLTTFAWAKAGVSLVQQSEWQIAQSKPIPVEAVQPGDLVQKPGHIALALGAGHVIVQAPKSGDVVRVGDWGTWPKVFASPTG